MKLLIDMSLSPLWVRFFEQHGIEALHWSNVGRASAPDAEIMEFAGAKRFVVFTHDLDFGTLLATRKAAGPSVIQVRTQDVLPSRDWGRCTSRDSRGRGKPRLRSSRDRGTRT